MGCKKSLSVWIGVFVFIFIISFVSAVPQLTIHSPQNITYNSTKILVNVTSDEPVDFYFKNLRSGRIIVLTENTTHFEDFIYVKRGGYEFIIWANNSNGEINESIVFNATVHNPINVTSCGYLYSSDTEYILRNDVSGSYKCIRMMELRNASLNLYGNTITSGSRVALELRFSSDIEVFNGTVNGSSESIDRRMYPRMLFLEGTKFKFRDLNISGHIGIFTFSLGSTIFENVIINSTIGFHFASIDNTYFVDSTIIWNGKSPICYSSVAFLDQSDHSELYLEGVNISGFPDNNMYLEGTYTEFYLRNSNIDISKASYPNWMSDVRFIEQHLVIINVTDQFGVSGASSVHVLDNGLLPRYKGLESELETLSNPTADLYIPIGETGEGQEWITEKVTLAQSSSPVVITDYDFSNYTLTTRGWGSENYSEIILDLTDHNSTINVDFQITTPGTGEELPICTITQMLDLNNDAIVNIQDAIIVLRLISGQNVSVSETSKSCEGINFNPF